MDRLEATNESSLSAGVFSLYISAAIEQHHLHKSIFRLFTTQEIIVEILSGNKVGRGLVGTELISSLDFLPDFYPKDIIAQAEFYPYNIVIDVFLRYFCEAIFDSKRCSPLRGDDSIESGR